jgi:hypothetical protein
VALLAGALFVYRRNASLSKEKKNKKHLEELPMDVLFAAEDGHGKGGGALAVLSEVVILEEVSRESESQGERDEDEKAKAGVVRRSLRQSGDGADSIPDANSGFMPVSKRNSDGSVDTSRRGSE